MKPKKSDALSNMLSQSLASESQRKPREVIALPTSGHAYPSLLKTTIALQAEDQRLADEVLSLLKEATGFRGGLSEAVKIAMRLCPLDKKEIARVHEEIRAADGRKARKLPE